jgi:PhzF family phenazine biosynthesis protein
VDVFGRSPFRGNPVAVVLDADGLTDQQMQRFARWTNLSETTFVLPPTTPEADYRVRIFTGTTELPFAGHPTLGTCRAWLEEHARAVAPPDGRDVVQECAAGLVRIHPDGAELAFAAPPLRRTGRVDDSLLDRVATVLRIGRDEIVDAQWVDNGPPWIGVLLADPERVLALTPGFVDELYVGVVGPYPPGSTEAIEVRAFLSGGTATIEDPVTGSLNASLASWLVRTGRVTLPYVARQGTVLDREGRVRLSGDLDQNLWVGGSATVMVEGWVEL